MRNLDVLQQLGDFYVKHQDKELFDESIESYWHTVFSLYLNLFQLNLSTSPYDVRIGWITNWVKFDTSSATPSGAEYHLPLDVDYISIPTMQSTIEEPFYILVEDNDYRIEDDTLKFNSQPPSDTMYANRARVNRYDLFSLYGSMLSLSKERDSEEYLYKIQALWTIMKTGSTPANIRKATYVFFGLPFAYEDGTVKEINGSELVIEGNNTYTYNSLGLSWEVEAGDTVEKYQPLSEGVEVFDHLSDPLFIYKIPYSDKLKYIEGGTLDDAETWLTYSLFAIGVDPAVYTYASRDSLLEFIRRIKPVYVNVEIMGYLDVNNSLTLTDSICDIIGKDFTYTIWYNPTNTYGLPSNVSCETLLFYDDFSSVVV